MAENKTKASEVKVADYLAAVEPAQRRADGQTVCALMQRLTGEEPKMWGPSMIGFGSYHYKYDSGREGDMFRLGFAPRKASLVLYGLGSPRKEELLAKLGKYKSEGGCVYVNKLSDIDMNVLEEMIRAAIAEMDRTYPRSVTPLP
jgi:hypothetical protein